MPHQYCDSVAYLTMKVNAFLEEFVNLYKSDRGAFEVLFFLKNQTTIYKNIHDIRLTYDVCRLSKKSEEIMMENIYKSVTELVGGTPLFEVVNIEKKLDLKAKILVKLEYFNPAGSIKDRVALQMIEDAEANGRIREGGTIIEPTSGNTGIGLAAIAASKGYKAIFVMPETMSIERRKLLLGYGAEIVLTEGAKGMNGAIERAEQLEKELGNALVLGQFINPSNPKVHRLTTGKEIWKDTDGNVDIFIAGVGTGGTITGVGGYLKEQNKNVRIIAVEPYRSAVLSGEKSGAHGLQGIGAGFIPEVLDTSIYDAICPVKEEEAYGAAKLLAKTEGLLVGISSGAAFFASIQEAKKEENTGKTIVAILPDTGERYLSTPLFE